MERRAAQPGLRGGVAAGSAGNGAVDPAREAQSRDADDGRGGRRSVPPREPIDLVRAPVAHAQLRTAAVDRDAEGAVPAAELSGGSGRTARRAARFRRRLPDRQLHGDLPNVQDALPLNLGAFKTQILPEGYKLLDEPRSGKVFEQILPPGPSVPDQRGVPEDLRRVRKERQERNHHHCDGKLAVRLRRGRRRRRQEVAFEGERHRHGGGSRLAHAPDDHQGASSTRRRAPTRVSSSRN